MSLVVWMGFFLGYTSSSRAFRVWILEAKQVVETCEVSFDETMPCTTPAFELSDDEGGPLPTASSSLPR